MAGIADLLFSLTGNKDPRQQLMEAAAMAAQPTMDTSATPQATGATPGAPTGQPGTGGAGTPSTAPVAQAYQSPPDLVDLYSKLADREDQSRSFDRGLGLIGSAFAQEQNRPAILQAFGVGDGGGQASRMADPLSIIGGITKLRNDQIALQRQAQLRAAVPSIAKRYNLDPDTASYLFESGQLGDVVKEAQKPNNEIVTQSDGTFRIVNKSTGDMSAPFGVPKKREIKIISDDQGNQFAIYGDTGQRVGENIVNGSGSTSDEKLWHADEADRKARGLPSRSLSDFIDFNNRSRAGQANEGPNGVSYGNPPNDMAWKRDASGKVVTDDQGVPVAVPIGGSKLDAAGKLADEQSKAAQQGKEATADIVTEDIDRLIANIDKNKDRGVLASTGAPAAVTQFIPGTPSYNAKALADTVRANVGFDKLQSMRAASKTGAALGPVSDFENKLLQATVGNLELSQDPEQVRYNLTRVKKLYTAIIDHGVKDQAAANRILGETPKGEQSLDDLLKKYGAK